MRCKDIMKADVEACWMMDPAAHVADRMRAFGIGFMPVCNDDGEVVGTITDRDLATRVLARRLPHDTPIQRVMSTGVVTCSPHDQLGYAEQLMRTHQKSRIVCVDDRGRPVGVISLSDLAEEENVWRAGRTLREVASRETHRYLNG